MVTRQEGPSPEIAKTLLEVYCGTPIQSISLLITGTGGDFGENHWDLDDVLIAHFGREAFNKARDKWMNEPGSASYG